MNTNIICTAIGIAGILCISAHAQTADGNVDKDAKKQYMSESGVILDICVYEQEFTAPENVPEDAGITEGTLIRRAVVTGVHKGNVKIGAKIEIEETVINPPAYLKSFRSVVAGDLLTYFYFGNELPEAQNGRHLVDHNQMSFDRCSDEEVKAFLRDLHSAQKAKSQSEPAGAGQPATRPVVEPEGGDKPQPEAEGRSR